MKQICKVRFSMSCRPSWELFIPNLGLWMHVHHRNQWTAPGQYSQQPCDMAGEAGFGLACDWTTCFPTLNDPILPRVWAPTVPHEQICSDRCQQGHPCCDLGKLSTFISRPPWRSANNIVNRSCSICPWAACPPGCQDCSQADSQHAEGSLKQGLWDKPLLSIKCHRIFNAHAEQAAVTQRTFSTLKLYGNYLPLKLCLAYRDSNI